jgi:ABC-type antimicrobial peptide transport system permease subunit
MFARIVFRIRSSIRAFAKTPGISLALLTSIALGVGSNASIGGFIAGLAHPGSSVSSSNQIVSIFAHDRSSDAGPLSDAEYREIRNRARAFSWVDAVRIAPIEVVLDGHPKTLMTASVMPELAKALNLRFKGGVVLSDRLFESLGGGNGETGSRILINNHQLPISGVAPRTLEGIYEDRPIDLWMPYEDGAGHDANPNRRDLWVLGGLRHGVSANTAQREIAAAFKNADAVEVIPYSGVAATAARGLASIIRLLQYIAGAVFLIACINVASLLLGRAFKRSSETSLRVALGATRRALSGELLSDSVVIAVSGGILGLLLALEAKQVIPNLLFQEDAERLSFVPPIASIITSALVCMSITALSGMMPIFATVADRPWAVLQREQGFSSIKVVRLRSALVVLQIALCCALVIFATLLLQGFHAALRTGLGQTLGNPILATVQSLPPPNISADYFKAVEESAKSFPDVVPVAWASQLPGSQSTWESFRIQAASTPLHDVDLDISEFTRDSQDQPEQEPTAGRLFTAQDLTCRAAVVNASAADVLSRSATAGERVFDRAGLPVHIIGVVHRITGITPDRRPTIYFDPMGPYPHGATKGALFRAPAALTSSDIALNVNIVSSGYAQALGLPAVAGHWFSDRSRFSDPCRHVGVVNQEAANLFFGGKPLGVGIIDQDSNQTEIIGVVRSQGLGIFQQYADPTVFIPDWQNYPLRMTLILRWSKATDQDLENLRRKIESVPGGAAPPQIETLDTQLTRSALAPLRIATLISLVSAFAALTVSMIGVFSTQSDVHRERRKVLALHVAFGARGWRVMLTSLRESGRLVFAGCLAGAGCSIALERILLIGTGLLSRTPVRSWLVALLLPGLAVLLSATVAALRSLSVDPMVIMRDQ